MKPEDYKNYEQIILNLSHINQTDPKVWVCEPLPVDAVSWRKNVLFNYSFEKSPEHILSSIVSQINFVKELASDIEDVMDEYIQFVGDNSKLPTPKIMEKWLGYFGTSAEDPFGYEVDLNMFIQCEHEFTFSEFDDEDWLNYANVCVRCLNNKQFQKQCTDILLTNLGEESDIYQYYLRCMDEQDNV